jgi:hypothetical protein
MKEVHDRCRAAAVQDDFKMIEARDQPRMRKPSLWSQCNMELTIMFCEPVGSTAMDKE